LGALLVIILISVLAAACAPRPAPASETAPPTFAAPADSPTPPATPAPPLSPHQATGWWQPAAGLSWQWQLSDDEIDTSVEADVYDLDLYVDPSAIHDLHAKGRRVLCYISVGSWEEWRPDADRFPADLLGKEYDDWPGEKWLDIRQIDRLAPILRARFDLCKAKGFDGIEPDNMETCTNDTGFPLTCADQLEFARWLAEEAHRRGLAIAQKNASGQAKDLVDLYDLAIIEDAFTYGWVEEMLPFVQAGKPVFAAEYTDLHDDQVAFCPVAQELGFSLILKNRDLDAWLQTCP